MANKKKENERVPTPFSRLDIYKELQAIKDRVSNVLESYEESGPTLSYKNEEVDYVKSLIAKYEENRQQRKAALKAVNKLCRAQLEKFDEFDSEYSTNEIPSELLKDIQHHEFKNAYDVALKSLDKLASIMSFVAQVSKESENLSTEKSGVVQATKETYEKSVRERRASMSFKSDYASTYLKQIKLEAMNSKQEKELKSIKAAYNELLSEKQKSIDAIKELKKELNQAHKEVETLQKSLKKQQITAKHRKLSTAYHDNDYNKEIPARYAQEVKTLQANSDNQPKTLTKDRNMSSSTTYSAISYNEETLTTKQKDYSSTSDSSSCSSSTSSNSNHDLKTPSKKHEVAFDIHMHGQNGAQTKVGNIYKDRSNENRVRKNILPSNGNTTKLQPVLNLKSEDSRNNKFKATSQQKIESKLPDIHSPKVKTGNTLNPSHYTSRDPVKLPEVYLRPGHNSNLLSKSELKSTPDDSKISKQADHTCKQQPPSPKAVVKLLLDLHDKEELTTNQIKDQNEVLNTLIKGPVYGFTEEEQLDKAAQVMVEYVNMSQSINKIGQILKEHCDQDNKAYQMDVLLTEEDSRIVIKKHYSGFVESMISTVDFVDKEMRRDGIFGSEYLTQALKEQWFNPDCFPLQNEQSKHMDFITMITNALETINYNRSLYLRHTKQLITEQEKRLSSLQKANPQVYQKCITQLKKVSQFPHLIDKSIQEGIQQMYSMLENHIVKVQSAIKTFNYKRDLLTAETKSKVQSHIPEMIKIIDKIYSLCVEDGPDAIIDGLQNSIRQLNKLCKNIQIVQEYEDNAIEKAPPSFLEQSKSVITEVQGHLKNIISSKLGVEMPDQFDFEVTGKSICSTVKQPTAVLPALSSRYIQNYTGLSCNKPLHSEQPSIGCDGQNSNRINTSRRNSMWDPLVYHSPLVTMVESSNLAKGIKGVTICRPMTSKGNTQHKSRLPILHVNDRGRRNCYQDNMRIKITINSRANKKQSNGRRVEPLDCFKITSLSHKTNNNSS